MESFFRTISVLRSNWKTRQLLIFFKKATKNFWFPVEPKKFTIGHKNFTKNLQIWNFFPSFGVISLHYPRFRGFWKFEANLIVFVLQHVVLRSPRWRNTKKRRKYWVFSMLHYVFLQEYQVSFFHYFLSENISTCKRVLLKEFGNFVSSVKILIVQKLWKLPILLIHLILQTEFSQQLQLSVHQPKSQLQTWRLWGKILLKNQQNWSLYPSLLRPKFPEKC